MGQFRQGVAMRTSAVVIGVGLLLIAAQVAFSDGARPNLVSLPISLVPVTLGTLLLASGIVLGLVFGNARYRVGVACLACAGLLLLFGVLQAFYPSYGALVASVALGIVGLALCVAGVRGAGRWPA